MSLQYTGREFTPNQITRYKLKSPPQPQKKVSMLKIQQPNLKGSKPVCQQRKIDPKSLSQRGPPYKLILLDKNYRNVLLVRKKGTPWNIIYGFRRKFQNFDAAVKEIACRQVGIDLSDRNSFYRMGGKEPYTIVAAVNNIDKIPLHLGPDIAGAMWIDIRFLIDDIKRDITERKNKYGSIIKSSIQELSELLRIREKPANGNRPNCQKEEDPREDSNKRCTIIVFDNTRKNVLILFEESFPINLRRWGFPKGRIKVGETETQCAARELCEEVGIELDRVKHQMVYTGKGLSLIFLNAAARNVKLTVGPEILKYRWVDLRQLEYEAKNDRGPQPKFNVNLKKNLFTALKYYNRPLVSPSKNINLNIVNSATHNLGPLANGDCRIVVVTDDRSVLTVTSDSRKGSGYIYGKLNSGSPQQCAYRAIADTINIDFSKVPHTITTNGNTIIIRIHRPRTEIQGTPKPGIVGMWYSIDNVPQLKNYLEYLNVFASGTGQQYCQVILLDDSYRALQYKEVNGKNWYYPTFPQGASRDSCVYNAIAQALDIDINTLPYKVYSPKKNLYFVAINQSAEDISMKIAKGVIVRWGPLSKNLLAEWNKIKGRHV